MGRPGTDCSVSPCTGSSDSSGGRRKGGSAAPQSKKALHKGKEGKAVPVGDILLSQGRRKDAKEKKAAKDDKPKKGESKDRAESSSEKVANGAAKSSEVSGDQQMPLSVGKPSPDSQDGTLQAESALPAPETDRMRQAIQALRQRRADLDASQEQVAKLSDLVASIRQELQAEREAKVTSCSSNVALQSQLTGLTVELESIKTSRNALQLEIDELRTELGEAQKAKSAALQDTASARSELEEVARAKTTLTSETESLRRQLSTLSEEAEGLRSRLGTVRAELEESQKAKAIASSERDALRKELDEGKQGEELNTALKCKAALTMHVDSLRNQLSEARKREVSIREDFEKLQAQIDSNGDALAAGAKIELEAAWEALVRTGLEQIRRALSIAGVRASPLTSLQNNSAPGNHSAQSSSSTRTKRPVSQVADLDLPTNFSLLAEDARKAAKRKRKEEAEAAAASQAKAGDDQGRNEKKQRKDKKDRKDKKERTEKEERRERERPDRKHSAKDQQEQRRKREKAERKSQPNEDSEEDKDVGGHNIVRADSQTTSAVRAAIAEFAGASPPVAVNESDTQSQDSDDKHRRDVRKNSIRHIIVEANKQEYVSLPPGRSSFKRRRKELRNPGRITFQSDSVGRTLISEVSIASYRNLHEDLWFSNPQANVQCDKCKRRLPQKLGNLKGGSGTSSFMCDEFVCADCVS